MAGLLFRSRLPGKNPNRCRRRTDAGIRRQGAPPPACWF